MATPHDLENLIRLGPDGKDIADACGCEEACACAGQAIEFAELTNKPSVVVSAENLIELNTVSGPACC